MEISKSFEGGKLSIALNGRLNTNTAPALEVALKEEGVKEILLDLSGLNYISSAGLRVLISAQKAVQNAGGSFTIAHANNTVRHVLGITGLDSLFVFT